MLDFDLDQYDGQQIDQFQKSGGKLPNGRYHCRLDGCKPVSTPKGSTGEELTFVIVGGPFAGQEISETLWDSDKEAAKKRVVLFASRLGLLVRSKENGKFAKAPGKHGFGDCFGAECVLEVKEEEYTKKDGGKGTACRVTFAGIWNVNDPEVKSVAKGKAGSVPTKPKGVDAAEL
jgi:hypothetical protein